MEPSKIITLCDWPIPKTKVEVQRFLGLASYYRRFVKFFAKVAKPLTVLTGKVPFAWNDFCQGSFENLKTYLSTAPVLAVFDPKKPTQVNTDASGHSVDAVLEQVSEKDGEYHPVMFRSRSINPHKMNYHPREQELLAILDCLKAWRPYLHGINFKIRTDHESLRYIET